MYTGEAQADITTATLNIMIMSYTIHFLKYVYTLKCITLMLASHLFLVNIHKPDTG